MSESRYEREEKLNKVMAAGLDAGPAPARVQARLEETYASLGSIPQDRPSNAGPQAQAAARPGAAARPSVAQPKGRGGRVVRRGAVVAAAAVLVVLLSGAAFAATTLLQMQPGEVPFFSGGKNLPIYGSLQEGVSSLNAEVGQTVEVDGVSVTLDSVSSDRNIVNLFFTLEKEGGFDLAELANYEGSQENEWSRLQRLAPRFSYTLASNGEELGFGQVNLLDAYQEGDTVKVMQRIVPEAVLPDQVDIALEGWAFWGESAESGTPNLDLSVGLDLSTVSQPRELGAQDLAFPTSEGDKTMGILRFTASELGTVMVVRNDEIETIEEGGRPMYRVADASITPNMLKVTDDQGNVLVPVQAGDGTGVNPAGSYVVEYAGLAPDATGVTFTPMTPEESGSLDGPAERSVDVSQIGTKLETSAYGGYELTGWNVADGTVSISLKPYGWVGDNGTLFTIELDPDEQPTPLHEEYADPETGETYGGHHTGIRYNKYDYLTGEIMQMTSYYAATDEELRELTQYRCTLPFGEFREEADAAQALTF